MARYVHIEYVDPAGEARVGSGYVVKDRTVLTANHVARGTGHRVSYDGRTYDVDPEGTVLSERDDVDLGVLRLKEVGSLPELSYARVSRVENTIPDCTVVGFPNWVAMAAGKYASKQIDGFIRTADQVPATGDPDVQPLELTITPHPSDPGVPQGESLDDSPWSGMSGAAVTCRNATIVVGVVQRHNKATKPNSLTVTPLSALRTLLQPKLREFCDALGISDIETDLVEVPDAASQGARVDGATANSAAGLASGSSAGLFSDRLVDYCWQRLDGLGVEVPEHWDHNSIERMYRDCEERVAREGTAGSRDARDVAKALWLAAEALPVLDHFGGQVIQKRLLNDLYRRHVYAPPPTWDSQALNELVFYAAGVGIREAYERGTDVTALARFMLGMASHWEARQKPSERISLDEVMAWSIQHLQLSLNDLNQYVSKIRDRTWKFIQLGTSASAAGFMQGNAREPLTTILIQTVTGTGELRAEYTECCELTSEEDVRERLSHLFSAYLPDGETVVDLFLPRGWLGVGIQHWEIIEVDGEFESLSSRHDVHLRWIKHLQNPDFAYALEDRSARVRWMHAPQAVPQEASSNPIDLKRWINERKRQEITDPPYFIGNSCGVTADHDPLNQLLRSGYGFLAWFPDDITDDVRRTAAGIAECFEYASDRKNKLPGSLEAELRQHKPIIVWSANERYMLPTAQTRLKGTRRSGRKQA